MSTLKLTDYIYTAFFSALTAILGFISIPLPFSPVPVSGQSLGVMLAGSVLKTKQAVLSVLIFVLLGAVGLPVFSGFVGGMSILIGPRGGYYVGFLVGAAAIALLKGKSNNIYRLFFANLVGGIFCVYLFGVAWLDFVTGMGIKGAFVAGALPFLPGDACKVFIATIIGSALNKRLPNIR